MNILLDAIFLNMKFGPKPRFSYLQLCRSVYVPNKTPGVAIKLSLHGHINIKIINAHRLVNKPCCAMRHVSIL